MKTQLKPVSEMNEEEIIAHYGVKGMKWGVIKKRASSFKKEVKSDTSPYRALAAKPIRRAVGGRARKAGAALSKATNEQLAKDRKETDDRLAKAHTRDVKILRAVGFKKLAASAEKAGPPTYDDTVSGKLEKGGRKAVRKTKDVARAIDKKAKKIETDPETRQKFELGVTAVTLTMAAVGYAALWKYS